MTQNGEPSLQELDSLARTKEHSVPQTRLYTEGEHWFDMTIGGTMAFIIGVVVGVLIMVIR
jgi:hypothetical protein